MMFLEDYALNKIYIKRIISLKKFEKKKLNSQSLQVVVYFNEKNIKKTKNFSLLKRF